MSKRSIRKLRHRTDFKTYVALPKINNLQITPAGAARTIMEERGSAK